MLGGQAMVRLTARRVCGLVSFCGVVGAWGTVRQRFRIVLMFAHSRRDDLLMVMSKEFAAAVAGLVPVVLLLVVVDVAANRRDLGAVFREIARPAAVVRSMGRRPALREHEVVRAERATEAVRAGWNRLVTEMSFAAGSAVAAVLLFQADFVALKWLAEKDPGPASGDAKFCLVALMLAFIRVGLGPVVDLVVPLVRGLAGVAPVLPSQGRLSRELQRRGRRDGEA
ncbi:hypothetical protein [Streptomyces sp. NPDC059271]|uniref:hypothetical protein n=1 Tax=Streptomyces sp. NPDC059271 TaxID=3346799 RepID=UPI0036886B97